MSARGAFCKPIFACDSCKEVIASSGLSMYHVMISRLLQYGTESSANERVEVGKGALLRSFFLSGSALSQTQGDHKSPRELGDIIWVLVCPCGSAALSCWQTMGGSIGLRASVHEVQLEESQATGCYYRP
jgi:hypothetical protein